MTSVSKVLGYGYHDGKVHLHIAPASTMSPVEMLRDVKSGFKALAADLQAKDGLHDAEEITATSWIVAKNPRLLERFGFTVHGKIADDIKDYIYLDSKHISQPESYIRNTISRTCYKASDT